MMPRALVLWFSIDDEEGGENEFKAIDCNNELRCSCASLSPVKQKQVSELRENFCELEKNPIN